MILDLFEISMVLGGLFGVFFLGYKFWYLPRKAKLGGSAIRILLFEQIGNDVVFLGESIGEEMPDEALGVYIRLVVGKDKKVISDVVNTDLFYDSKYSKCLMICKYADDDYRVMARLRSQEWFKKVLVDKPMFDKKGEQIFEDVEITNPETGEVEIERLPKTEKVEAYEGYNEPVGISQEGREVMRFNREWHKRMEERRKEKASFWEKYGAYVMLGSMMLIILMSTAYNANKFELAADHMAAAFGEKADEYLDKMDSPSFISTIISKVESRNLEVPPT